ncbi:hypothetical protein [Gloeocapsa sp. PCC 73106]|uniref:hypothetical protein n=1 Tax=Gloeocapsa sp. PCC 73106 TaxID=102232 RepID=UPI0002ACCA38|nr:hypothetical protein [Gloeocapsa sp. PCC 73106]ELR98489.1 hypothetical protein GLO73106DRAFT_00023220 [Gloeocapsa sp. PCC 73106]
MIKQPLENDINSSKTLVKSNVVSIYTQSANLNPVDAQFNFSLWARAVKEQMLAAIDKRA